MDKKKYKVMIDGSIGINGTPIESERIVEKLHELQSENEVLRARNRTTLNDYREEARLREELELENTKLRHMIADSATNEG